MEPTYQITDNADRKQYELELDGALSRVEYIKVGNRIYLTHTEVPKKLAGQGIASKLIAHVLEDVKRQKLRLIPLCPYAAGYISRHPEWNDLLDQGINV